MVTFWFDYIARYDVHKCLHCFRTEFSLTWKRISSPQTWVWLRPSSSVYRQSLCLWWTQWYLRSYLLLQGNVFYIGAHYGRFLQATRLKKVSKKPASHTLSSRLPYPSCSQFSPGFRVLNKSANETICFLHAIDRRRVAQRSKNVLRW